jgi:hypothetical protein
MNEMMKSEGLKEGGGGGERADTTQSLEPMSMTRACDGGDGNAGDAAAADDDAAAADDDNTRVAPPPTPHDTAAAREEETRATAGTPLTDA